jgi:hypothetical protein
VPSQIAEGSNTGHVTCALVFSKHTHSVAPSRQMLCHVNLGHPRLTGLSYSVLINHSCMPNAHSRSEQRRGARSPFPHSKLATIGAHRCKILMKPVSKVHGAVSKLGTHNFRRLENKFRYNSQEFTCECLWHGDLQLTGRVVPGSKSCILYRYATIDINYIAFKV